MAMEKAEWILTVPADLTRHCRRGLAMDMGWHHKCCSTQNNVQNNVWAAEENNLGFTQGRSQQFE